MLNPDDYHLEPDTPVLIEAMDFTWQFRWADAEADVRSGFSHLVAVYWGTL